MPINVTVFDTGIEGRTPLVSSSFITLEVDEGTSLNDFFGEIRHIANTHRGITNLFLITKMARKGGQREESGLQFGADGINEVTVEQFAAIAGLAEQITIFECANTLNSIDFDHPDVITAELSKTYHGDGNELYQAIAQHSGTKVSVFRESREYAAEAHNSIYSGYEVYCESGPVDFSDWEGSIMLIDETGNVFDEMTNPISWRDSSGSMVDPRLEAKL